MPFHGFAEKCIGNGISAFQIANIDTEQLFCRALALATMVESRFLSLTKLGQVYATETGIVVHYGTEKVAIDVVKADLLRVRISRGGEFDTTPTFALAVEPIGAARAAGYDTHFEVVIGQDQVELVTSHLVAQIQLEPFGLFITRTDGSVVLVYRSKRALADFAQGLLEACIAYFNEPMQIARQDIPEHEGHHTRFTLTNTAHADLA